MLGAAVSGQGAVGSPRVAEPSLIGVDAKVSARAYVYGTSPTADGGLGGAGTTGSTATPATPTAPTAPATPPPATTAPTTAAAPATGGTS